MGANSVEILIGNEVPNKGMSLMGSIKRGRFFLLDRDSFVHFMGV
jgi:hypothetical protein